MDWSAASWGLPGPARCSGDWSHTVGGFTKVSEQSPLYNDQVPVILLDCLEEPGCL